MSIVSYEPKETHTKHPHTSQRIAIPSPQSHLGTRGRFVTRDLHKTYVRGVTYGGFPPCNGCEFPSQATVARDFAAMAQSGFNAVRTYAPPPRWMLDLAQGFGLALLVGIPWEQHVAFLETRKLARSIERRVADAARAYAGHPALLGIAVGNEIPAAIVRWHGAPRIERFLSRLYEQVKDACPEALVTYVNYPSTEYLELPFLDLVCFNVYLETPAALDAYLARLHNLADDRPLILAELGLDSQRNGVTAQARTLRWQLRSAYDGGCAGAFVFSWTDEWYRGGREILDWDFGLTDRKRRPKPALAAVAEELRAAPFDPNVRWPLVSVVVCTYNGERTIRECLTALRELDYPHYEVIVINDGSTDGTAEILATFADDFQVITTTNRGLSHARNTGLAAARGAITAYIDDDAYPDPHWLRYLALGLTRSSHAAMGGPNLPPPGDGFIAECVANAPGGPTHVLLSDSEAEHIPGCNMAFRTEALRDIGGFDPQFRVAGDDVDVCWRLEARGLSIGFNAAAVVFHHRRGSIRAYLRQQRGYGKAEALLAAKWPHKYNELGHLRWMGRVYGRGVAPLLSLTRTRVYHGVWNSAPYQSVYRAAPGTFSALVLMPEWYLLIALLAAGSLLGAYVPALLWAVPLLVSAGGLSLLQACMAAARARFPARPRSPARVRWMRRATIAALHLAQPLVRLRGRLEFGLTPFRLRGQRRTARLDRLVLIWTQRYKSADERLSWLESRLRELGTFVYRGGDFDRWDLEVRGGLLARMRLQLAIEDHEGGKQLMRMRLSARYTLLRCTIGLLLAGSVLLAQQHVWFGSGLLGALGALLLLRCVQEHAVVATAIRTSVDGLVHHERAHLMSATEHPQGAHPTLSSDVPLIHSSERSP